MRSDLVLLLTIVGASVYTNSPAVDAVPIYQLLSTPQSFPIAPSVAANIAGRTQIKYSNIAVTKKKTSLRRSTWYRNSDRRFRSASFSLEGHIVVDEDDDDAGNELLDTETDDLILPDDDYTIEGEILEEEGDDEFDFVDDHDVENTHFQTKFTFPSHAVVLNSEDTDSWVKENGLQDGDLVPESFEDEEEEEEEEEGSMEVEPKPEEEILSEFGGNSAAADLAADEP
ncbi:hypothetical protein BGZ80_008066 [Entomortierella chlamydospora]|uniref:Uncharacterized protein n=1 Tax=Entomortierella chlamydospora TaxID=101097 RepID=A0A9P6MXQ0_9FUNG|nr:hypothetical protein BGZ79_007132 [Entomortierella chlamydospora]KAG0017648.1 hypothetical protein BGZ80_008066 [Entomortierella chlamydospora]